MILITGATGHLGVNLTMRLQDLGLPVRLLVRNPQKVRTLSSMLPEKGSLDGCQQVVGDIRDLSVLDRALVGVDQVVHCCHSHGYWSGASHVYDVNIRGAEALTQAVRNSAAVEKIVFVGSYSAHAMQAQETLSHPPSGTSARECSSVSKRLAQWLLTEASHCPMGPAVPVVPQPPRVLELDGESLFGVTFH